MPTVTLFFWLLVSHAIADYPLQGDFLARGKNHKAPIPGIPWYQCLFWHAVIHGGAVALITQSIPLGCAEFVIHIITDYAKCDGRLTFNEDQAIHVACKVLWAAIAIGIR